MTYVADRVEREVERLRKRLRLVIPKLRLACRSSRYDTEISASLVYGVRDQLRFVDAYVVSHETFEYMPIETFRRHFMDFIFRSLLDVVEHDPEVG